MSIISLNGVFQDNEEGEEIVSKFLQEQGGVVAENTRYQIAAAFEAEVRGDLDQAEAKYREVLRSVGQSEVVTEQLDRIRRRRELGG